MRLPLALRTARPGRLQLLVLSLSNRCDQRCVHCQIWSHGTHAGTSLTLAERLALADEALALGVREALLTGGEPLLSPDLWPVARRLEAGGVKLMLATNGMQLAARATEVAALFDEVYVSLDGPPATHDRVRGVASYGRLRAGIAALRQARPSVTVVARCTLHTENLAQLEATVDAARDLGCSAISFLPIDATSQAFGGSPAARRVLVPAAEDVAAFELAVLRLEALGELGGFVLETRAKLQALAGHLRASAGARSYATPDCDAPWWSVVVEDDGGVRPCFFHERMADAREGLARARGSAALRETLRAVARGNAVCERCVCPKRRSFSFATVA